SSDGAVFQVYNGGDLRGRLIDDLKVAKKRNQKHASRQANGVAHLLVVEGLKRNEESYLISEVPSYAKEVVDKDYRQLG
ncbi:hypothetical protein Gohar_027270, partial [Gossypium harknessii]|nr:hypothetical protein [Gossypium harknessii]